jgi:nucleotide-binding universal stress UspA family protein
MSAEIFQRILAADDGSPDGERAAGIAVRLAAKLKSEVFLLGVVEPANIQAEGEGLPLADPSLNLGVGAAPCELLGDDAR